MKRKLTASTLAIAMIFGAACNAATVQAYVNLIVGIALQVAQLAGAPKSAADKVAADLATANKLISDYRTADASAKPGKLAEIDTVLNVAAVDLNAILAAAQVADPKVIAAVRAGLGIAITAIESLRALATGSQPAPIVQAAARIAHTVPGVPKSKALTPAQLKTAYNQAIAAYPQAQLR